MKTRVFDDSADMRKMAKFALDDLLETLQFGSLCALGGFTPYPVRSALAQWPEDFA